MNLTDNNNPTLKLLSITQKQEQTFSQKSPTW